MVCAALNDKFSIQLVVYVALQLPLVKAFGLDRIRAAVR